MNHLKNVGMAKRVTLRKIIECAPNGDCRQWRAEDVPSIPASIGPAKGVDAINMTVAPPKEVTCQVVLGTVETITPGEFVNVSVAGGPDEVQFFARDQILSGSRTLFVTEVLSVNTAAKETTVLCREIRG